ncbi:MAG: outer rane efflux protein [Polyangiaceae bacterium]|jgi:outer membrane protein TolC|nr:outer rane efflux protein [Polyangiaceae bacterium]
MTRNAFAVRTSLALLLSSAFAFAQAPAPAPPVVGPAAPAAAPGAAAPTTLAPPPGAPGAAGPDAPVGKVTQALQERLEAMMRGNGLTANEVAERAVRSSSQLQAKRRSIESADAQVEQAKAGFYPALSLSARYTRLSKIDVPNLGVIAAPVDQTPGLVPAGAQLVAVPLSFPVILNNYVLQAQLNVPLSDYVLRTSRAVSGANRVKNASELDERATKLSVARDARVAYYQWIRVQGFSFVGAQSIEQAKGHLADSTNAFQAGLISKADVLRAQTGVKSAELFLERANSNVLVATARLRVLMRDTSGKPYEVGENILAPMPPMAGALSDELAYQEASRQRLELKLLMENESAIRDQAALTRAGNYPRLDAMASAQYSNPNPRYFPQEDKFRGTWDAGVMLSWTPTAIFGVQAGTRALEARAAEVVAQRQALLDSLQLEVTQALAAERDAQFAVTVSQQALASAEEGYRVRRELFRSGRATLVEVTDSETELTRARLELVNAHVDLRIAQVELGHVLGRDVK